MPRLTLHSCVYAKVFRDRFELRRIETGQVLNVHASQPFSTVRLLVGHFAAAEKALRDGIQRLHVGEWLLLKPKLVIHPVEMVDGGLSPVEFRVLVELAVGAGTRKAVVWVGHSLSDDEVSKKLKNE